MNPKFFSRVAFRTLLVAGMTLGAVGAVGAVTSAASAGGNTWYVATTGHDAGNNCSTLSRPCASITRALAEQALEAVGGTISVAAGTYNGQYTLTSANSHVDIKGKGATTILQPTSTPTSCATDPDTGDSVYAIVCVTPGTKSASVANLAINGLPGDVAALCGGPEYVGVYYDGATGKINKVNVSGIDLPASCFGAGSPIGGTAIYVTSTTSPADNSTVTISGDKVTATALASTTRADLLAGSYTNGILPVASDVHFTRGTVTVGGFTLSGHRDNANDIYVTGTVPEEVPSGSVVNYKPFTGAYNKNGIACDDPGTTCTITGSTVTGNGLTDQIAQNGILVWGSDNVTISTNHVSGNSFSNGSVDGLGSNGTGIYLLNVAGGSVTGNTTSANDANIYAGQVPLYSGSGLPAYPASFGTLTVESNIISNATSEGESSGADGFGEGIWLDGNDTTITGGQGSVTVEDNTIKTSAQAGIFNTGSSGVEILGNTITAGEAGMVFAGPSQQCAFLAEENGQTPGTSTYCNPSLPISGGWGSDGNAVASNIVGGAAAGAGNEAGIVLDGYFATGGEGLDADPAGSEGNVFDANTWDGNLLADAADFAGTGGNTYGSGASANTCTPTAAGSASADSVLGPNATVTNVTVSTSTNDLTDNSGNFPTTSSTPGEPGDYVSAGGAAVDTTTAGNIPAGDTLTNVSGSTATLLTTPTGNGSADTIAFYNYLSCGGTL
jgi:hypothetical protein